MRFSLQLVLLSCFLLPPSLYANDRKSPVSPANSDDGSFQESAIDLYVDTRTKQIYAEPGEGRVRMGTFERVAVGTLAAGA